MSVFRSAVLVLILVGAAAAAPQRAAAQSVPGSVTVLLPPISGAGRRPLSFGALSAPQTVTRTVTTVADTADANIGAFEFTGFTGPQNVQLTFTLPASLTNTTHGGATLPISFDGSYAARCFDRKNNADAICTFFNPTSPTTQHTFAPAAPSGQNTGVLRVYIGGQVQATTSTRAGLYQGLITVTAARI